MNKREEREKHFLSRDYTVAAFILAFMMFLLVMVGHIEVFASEDNDTDNSEQENVIQLEKEFAKNLNQTGYDVVFVIDNSRSVWKQQEYRNQAFRNITNLAIGSDIRIGVVYFADRIYKELKLTSVENEEGSKKVLDFLNMTDQDESNINTNIGTALQSAADMLDTQDSSRDRIVILFSDGVNENASSSDAYKKEADSATNEQTKRLEKMNASIYCVWIPKKNTDEETLKSIVNYYSEDNSYDKERFLTVEENNISKLSSIFVDVFYAMQNNMKYKEVELDASGREVFYLPSLGISKLNIFLEGAFQEGTKIEAAGESEHKNWSDGSASFLNYKNPVSGDWLIDVKSSDPDSVYGVIAYYVNPQAGAEVVKEEKNGRYHLIVHLYDEEGKEIEVDSQVIVTVTANYTGQDGSESTVPVEMTVNDGVIQSDSFELTEYGDYSFSIHVTYEDYIDLQFILSGMSVEKSAPITEDLRSGDFPGEKTSEGIQFSVAEDQLWEDPEGEEVTIIKTVQLNAANPVNVVQEDGYVVVTAEQAGDVQFELQIEDSSGEDSKVVIQGKVTDQGIMRVYKTLAVAAAAVFIAAVLLLLLGILLKIICLKKLFSSFDQTDSEFKVDYDLYEKENRQMGENKKDLAAILHSDEDGKGVIDMAAELSEEMQEFYEVVQYLDEKYEENVFQNAKQINKDAFRVVRNMRNLRKSVQAVRENQKNTKSVIKIMKENCKKAEWMRRQIENACNGMTAENEAIEEIIVKANKAGETLFELLNTEIVCDLVVKTPDGGRGVMSANGKKGYKTGFYSLDDVPLVGRGILGKPENFGKTGIYVSGFEEEETGKCGLIFLSTKEFALKGEKESVEMTKKARLYRGTEYELTVRTSAYQKQMQVFVK